MDINTEPQLPQISSRHSSCQVSRVPSNTCQGDKEVPVEALENNPPFWKKILLESKSPKVNDEIALSRRNAVNCLHVKFPNAEYNLSHENSNEFLKRNECGKTTEVPCSLKELNEYRKHLRRVKGLHNNEKQKDVKFLEEQNKDEVLKKNQTTKGLVLKVVDNEEVKSTKDEREFCRAEQDALKSLEWEKRNFWAETQERLDHWNQLQQMTLLEDKRKLAAQCRESPGQWENCRKPYAKKKKIDQRKQPSDWNKKNNNSKMFPNSSMMTADVYVRFKKSNIFFQVPNGNPTNILEYKNLMGQFFGNDNLTNVSVDDVADYLVSWVVKIAVDEYVDIADTIWNALIELITDGVNIQLENTLSTRCRIRHYRQSDHTLIQWVAKKNSQSAINLIVAGLVHLLRMDRLPNGQFLTSLAQRSQQMIVDTVLKDLHQSLVDRSEEEIQRLWRETLRVVTYQLDSYTKLKAISWMRDCGPSLTGFVDSGSSNSCRSALLLVSSSVVLSLCQSELIKVFVTTSDVPKDKHDSLIGVLLHLPKSFLLSMSMWADSHLWDLVNEIGKIPKPKRVQRIVLVIARRLFRQAHLYIRKAIGQKQTQISEDMFVDCIVDSLVTNLQQKLLTHSIGEDNEDIDNRVLDEWMRRLMKNAAMINDSVVDCGDKPVKEKSSRKRKLVAKNVSNHVFKIPKVPPEENDDIVSQEVNKYKVLHRKYINQILSSITLSAESIASEGTVPSKNFLAEIGFNLASQTATNAMQDLKISYQGLTLFPKCRTFMEYVCNSLVDKIEQKSKKLLDGIAGINENALASYLEATAINQVLELELLSEMVEKMEEILEADRQDCLRRNIDGSPLELSKLDELVTQHRLWVLDGIVNAVRLQVDILLKDLNIPNQNMVHYLIQESICKMLPEAMSELELKVRCLLENENVKITNFDGFLQEFASHVFHGTCANLNGAVRKECNGDASASNSCSGGDEGTIRTSLELFTALKNHRLYPYIVEVEKDIARQIVKLVEEETVMMNIGQLQVDSMEHMDELAFSVVAKIIQMVEGRIPSGGPELVAVWESPLLEHILKESSKILKFWESLNTCMTDALMQMDAKKEWFCSDKQLSCEDIEDCVDLMEEQVVHGIINRLLTVKILTNFEERLSGGIDDEEQEQQCTCSEEDRRFIWDITSMIFPSITCENGQEIEELHLAVHKFANEILRNEAIANKKKMAEDEIELLQYLTVTIVKEILNSRYVQSQLTLDAMTSRDSINVFTAVVIQEGTKSLVCEMISLFDKNILGILQSTSSEISEAVSQYIVGHFPLISQEKPTHLMVKSIDFGDATGQIVTSLVDDVREYIFYIVDELSELKKGVQVVKENVKDKLKRIDNTLSTITTFLKENAGVDFVDKSSPDVFTSTELDNTDPQMEKENCKQSTLTKKGTPKKWYVDVDLLSDKLLDSCRQLTQTKITPNPYHVNSDDADQVEKSVSVVLRRVRNDVRRQLVSTRIFVSCMVRFARRHLRESAEKLKNKKQIDSCFYVYEILPPPILRSRQNSNLQIWSAKSMRSGLSMSTLSEADNGNKMPKKIVSLDSVSRKRDSIFAKFRSLDGIVDVDSDKASTDFVPSSKKSTCRATSNDDVKSVSVCKSLECLLTRQMLRQSLSTLRQNLFSVGERNEVADTLTDILLKEVVDNLKREIFLMDLTSTPITYLPKHGSTSLPVICINSEVTDSLKGGVSHFTESADCRRYSDVSVGDKNRFVDGNGVYLKRSQDLLTASIICQTQRMAMKLLSTKPQRFLGLDLLDKIAKELADKFIMQTKVLLKHKHGRSGEFKVIDMATILGKIVKNVEEELEIGQTNVQPGWAIPEQVTCLTNTLLKQVCVELKEGMVRGNGEDVSRQVSRSDPKRKIKRRLRFKKEVVQNIPTSILQDVTQMPSMSNKKMKITRYLSSTSSSDSSDLEIRHCRKYERCRPTMEKVGTQMSKWIIKKLKKEAKLSIMSGSSRQRDHVVVTALENIIENLQDEKRQLTNRLHRSTNQGQVPPSWSGNPDRKPLPKNVDNKQLTSLDPLIESSATSSDIFDAVLDLVQQGSSTSENTRTHKPEVKTDPSTPSPRLKPIFEGHELDIDPADIELGLSAISLKRLSLSDLKKSSEPSARNSFRNVLHPDLSSVQLPSTSSGSTEAQAAVTNLIRQVADINKCTNCEMLAQSKRGRLRLDDNYKRSEEHRPKKAGVGVTHSHPPRDSAGTSVNMSVNMSKRSSGSFLIRKQEAKFVVSDLTSANANNSCLRIDENFDTGFDNVLDSGLKLTNKSAVTALSKSRRYANSDNDSDTTISTKQSKQSLDDVDISDLSHIETTVEQSEFVKRQKDDDSDEEEEEILLKVIDNFIDGCPKPEDYCASEND